MQRSLSWGKLSPRRREYLVLALIMLLAIFLRFYQLESIPVGIDGDQGADGYDGKRILRGEEYPIYITDRWGLGPMHAYFVAFSFALWGISPWAIRFASAAVGMATIPVVFWLAKELFPSDRHSTPSVALLSAFWVATSYWHITFSRAGLEVATLPFFSSITFYFLWRGIRSEKRWPFLVAGILLGVSLYGYRAARFLPFLLLGFFGYWLFSDRGFRQRHLIDLGLLVVPATLIFAPLALYAIIHPDIFFAREMHAFVFHPEVGQGTPVRDLAEAFLRTMGMFSLKGDPSIVWNPGQRPVLDPISSACFVCGLVAATLRWKQRSYSFVLVWFLIMALPGALTFEHLPSFTRGIGALPALCLLSGIGVIAVKEWWERNMSWPGARQIIWTVLCFVLVSTSFLGYRDYFTPSLQRLAKGEIEGQTYIEAAAVMNTTRIPDGVWILPATSLRPRELPYYEVDFLYDGPEPEYTLYVDEGTAPAELSEICQGHRRAVVVNWKWYVLEEAYTSWNSDPKGLLDFLLSKYGQRTSEEPFESFDLVTYQLPDSPDFKIAHSFEPLDASFGDELRLVGIAFGGSSLNPTSTKEEIESRLLPSGKEGWVVLQWQAIGVPSKDYKVGVYLLDGRGCVVGQVDKLLLSNYLQPTSGWNSGQIEMDYYTLPSLPATAPGEYSIEVVVYDPETMERLALFDQQPTATKTTLRVGTLRVNKPLEAAHVEPMEKLPRAESNIAPSIRLLGYDLPMRVISPGETVSIALYWQALDDVRQDYLFSLSLRDADGQGQLQQRGRPVDDTYPTTEWNEGEVLRDWHGLVLPPDLPQGVYEIFVGVLEEDELLGEVALGQIEVKGRARRFTIPEIQHPMEARLGEAIQFLGYYLSNDEVTAGGTLQFTLYWQALEEMQASYIVFTHLLDTENRIWGQRDSIPDSGQAPTTSWVEGEIVSDEYEIVVDPEAPAGEYVIEIGMYDAGRGERLRVYDINGALQGDRILLHETQVVVAE